jgi:hypothetical protein
LIPILAHCAAIAINLNWLHEYEHDVILSLPATSDKTKKKAQNEMLSASSSRMCLRLTGLTPVRQGDPMEISGLSIIISA